MSGQRFVGSRYPRLEDPALIQGQGVFIDDIHLPGQVEATFLRSPIAHGLIRRLETKTAKRLSGVKAVFTLADLRPMLTADRLPLQFPSTVLPPNISPFILADREVSHVGEVIALVVAESRYIAEDALALIELEIDPLPIAADCREALNENSPRAHLSRPSNLLLSFQQSFGDAHTAVREAPRRLSLSLKQHRGGAHPIECRGVLANYERWSDQLTVWCSSQLAHETRFFIMKMLGLDENRVRVITPDVGGGFGAKFIVYPEEIAVSAASRLLGLPIKWIEDRQEHFVGSIQERDQYWDLCAGFDNQGLLLGVHGTMISDAGAFTYQGINMPYNASTSFPGPYVLPAYHLEVQVVETNKVGTAPVRGAGYPEGCFAMERVLDAIARDLGIGKDTVRRRNLVPGDAMPYETPMKARSTSQIVYDSGDFPACLNKALKAADFEGFETRRAKALSEGRYLGFGIAAGIKGSGRGPFEAATVRVGRSGAVSIYTGAMAMGQGLKTALAQIAADELGVEPSDITVICGDTSTIQLGLGGFASRQTVTAGNSVLRSARAVREKALLVASQMLEVPLDKLDFADGRIRERGKNISLSLGDIADTLAGAPGYNFPADTMPGLESSDHFMVSALTYGLGVHAVEVEVEPRTGAIAILSYVVVTDCGTVVNPMMAEGQIHGGVAHGIGNALFEWMGYDADAQPITTTLADYLLPSATDVPDLKVILEEYPTSKNPLGVKGIGEAGTVPAAPAIISAVEDAVREFEVQIDETPIGPARLVELIKRGRSSSVFR